MARTDVTYAYAADITKIEKDPETGDYMVYGKATGPDLDLDGQICDPKWLKSAMPGWMEWGNVRAMHQPIVAGVGVEMDSDDEGNFNVLSRCVDADAAKKLETRAYKGYSVGIKNARVVKDANAPGGRIVGGEIVELSYVDRPCNPTAKLAIAKGVGLSDDGGTIEVEDGAEALPVDLMPVELDELPEAHPDEPVVEDALPDAPKGAEPSGWERAVGADLTRRLKRLVPSVDLTVKATAAEDVSTAQQAIGIIARLIQSEADGLAAGQMCDAYQISCLLRAVDALTYFIECESSEPAPAATVEQPGSDYDMNGTVVELAAETDKGATVGTDLDKIVKDAVAEATKAQGEELAALRADLAKAMARPTSGGPVLARPRAAIASAGERELTLAKAEEYETQALAYQSIDVQFADALRTKAAAIRLTVKD